MLLYTHFLTSINLLVIQTFFRIILNPSVTICKAVLFLPEVKGQLLRNMSINIIGSLWLLTVLQLIGMYGPGIEPLTFEDKLPNLITLRFSILSVVSLPLLSLKALLLRVI